MSGFSNLKITSNGKELIAKILLGKQVDFSKVKIGDGIVEETLMEEQEDLSNVIKECQIENIEKIDESKIKITFYFKNIDCEQNFYFREIGIFAIDKETGEEILFAYANAGEKAEYIYTQTTEINEKYIDIIIACGNTANINIKINDSEIFVTEKKLEQKTQNINNKINGVDSKLQSQINGLASGSPLVASSVSEMTDTNRVYVNTNDGHWYWYNGTNWIDGGVYQATELDEKTLKRIEKNIPFATLKNGDYDLDLIWEKGGLDVFTGAEKTSQTLIRSEFIYVADLNYFNLNFLKSCNVVVIKYDENKNYIGTFNKFNENNQVTPYKTDIKLINDNVKYIRVFMANSSYSSSITISDGLNISLTGKYEFNYEDVENQIKTNSNNCVVDLEWELGGLWISTTDKGEEGEENTSSTLIRTKYYNCKNAELLKFMHYANAIVVFFYDKNKKFTHKTDIITKGISKYIQLETGDCYFRIILNNNDLQDISFGNLCYGYILNKSIFKGKKISILGDSISTYENISPSDKANAFYPNDIVDDVSYVYWKQVQTCLMMDLEVNNSYSSSTVIGPNSTYSSFSDDSRLSSLGNPDVIIVEGGTNDIYAGKNSSELTTYKFNEYDKSKFTEAYAYVIRKLQELYPNAKILCLTPNYIYNEGNYSNRTNCTFSRINDICNSVIDVCDKLGVKVVDLRKAGINYSNILNMTTDGLHWNKIGHSLVANLVIRELAEMEM